MKILYKQNKNKTSTLENVGITNCYLKHITRFSSKNATVKTHHHTFFEVHIITCGYQVYKIGNELIRLEEGALLFIAPLVEHQLVDSSRDICKFAICFKSARKTERDFFKDNVSDSLCDGLRLLYEEGGKQTELSTYILECRLCEIIIKFLREAGCTEGGEKNFESENTLLSLAKQYISDNIERSPKVSEIASYCSICTRQLTRIFIEHEKLTPKEFITNEKIRKISELILDEGLSLRQISERMGFGNEYYFNTFFKKHFGLPPSEYRRMHGK